MYSTFPPAGDGKWRVEAEAVARRDGQRRNDPQRQGPREGRAARTSYVHRRDGRIQYENTYGEDPHQQKE